MVADDRMTEIRDLLVQLLELARNSERKRDELLGEQRSALAEYRRMQRAARRGLVVLVVLLVLLVALLVAIYL